MRALWIPILLGGIAKPLFAATPPSPEQIEFFEKRIRPVLVERCMECHNDKKAKAGLYLKELAGIAKQAKGKNSALAGQIAAEKRRIAAEN